MDDDAARLDFAKTRRASPTRTRMKLAEQEEI